MRARKSLGKWLAAALVAAAGVVLSGCPHNNLIDGGGAGGPAGGSRGGNGEVKLIVTNFAADSGGGRSSSWLAPSRTIAPDHIDLKAEKDKYVFVAEGTSNGGEAYGPEYITLEDDGSTSLGIAGGGIWTVTVSAYDVTKLNGLGMGTTPTDIMQGKTAKEVKNGGDTALVLQGKATLDLGMNSTGSVTVTLTNDGVGTEGDVGVTINFKTRTDIDKINTRDYKVTVALYDYTTSRMVGVEDEIRAAGAGATLTDAEVVNIDAVPKGRYQFRLTVTEAASGNAVAYWADDIFVEGNRSTDQEVDVANLFIDPAKPQSFEVYWSEKQTGELQEGFLAYLAWAGIPYNAIGVDVEIADITNWYKYAAQQHQVDFTGGNPENLLTHDNLWDAIDTDLSTGAFPEKEEVVTSLRWANSPQDATAYPAIYRSGSQLNGSDGIVFLMQTGHIYSMRIRAAGARGSSDWTVVGITGTPAVTDPDKLANVPSGAGKATKFALPATNGLFDLVQVKYDLKGQYKLYKTTAPADIGTEATAAELAPLSEYQGGTPVQLQMKYVDMSTPQRDDWFLYTVNKIGTTDDRVKTWTGWQDKIDPTKKFTIIPVQMSYNGYTDLTLLPLGADGSLLLKAETPDTFNVLNDSNVLVQIRNDTTTAAPTTDWNLLSDGDENPQNGGTGGTAKDTKLELMKDTSRYILNLDKAGMGNPAGATKKTVLYVSVGKDAQTRGTLTDKNGSDFLVKDISVSIMSNGITPARTFTKGSDFIAYASLDGFAPGDYTLRVEVLSAAGYWVSHTEDLIIKYDGHVIQ